MAEHHWMDDGQLVGSDAEHRRFGDRWHRLSEEPRGASEDKEQRSQSQAEDGRAESKQLGLIDEGHHGGDEPDSRQHDEHARDDGREDGAAPFSA